MSPRRVFRSRAVELSWLCFSLGGLTSNAVCQSQDEGKTKKSHSWIYEQNAPEFTVKASAMPAEVQSGYHVFRSKCGECHSLNRLLDKSDLSADEWKDIVFRMQDMASAHMSTMQSEMILKFVEWNDKNRKEDASVPKRKSGDDK